MEKLNDLIIDWLNTWEECSVCSDVCKLKHITGTNEDRPICKLCKYEESIL